MNPSNQRLRDLFDGDPGFYEYHQDYQEDLWTHVAERPGLALALLFVSALFIYQTLFLLDWALLSVPELLWNCIVYVTPSRLVDLIEDYQTPLRIRNPSLLHLPKTHAAKSSAMRRILGFDAPGGIISTVTQAGRRRLSILPGIGVSSLGGSAAPPGLGNWDNSCYQNSVLQGLASLETLPAYLGAPTVDEVLKKPGSDPELTMVPALRGLITLLKDPANKGKRVWTPATLKSMSSWQQQDAQEYYSKVLNEIEKEIGIVASAMNSSQGFRLHGPNSPENEKSSDPSCLLAFKNPLQGLLAQRVGCTSCGFSEGLSMIPFNCLTVPLGSAPDYNISDCINEYTKLEQIEGVDCGKCTLLKSHHLLSTLLERTKDIPENSGTHNQIVSRLEKVVEALEEDDYDDKTLLEKCKISTKSRVSSTKTRQAVIARPPSSLVVHINRSLFDEMTGELRKNYAVVRFPKILDLARWCLGSAGASSNPDTEEWKLDPEHPMIAGAHRPPMVRGPLYELRAVVTHYGRHENGHYICYKKGPRLETQHHGKVVADQWWRLSDDDVMKVSEEDVLGQGGVFMLFYDRIAPAVSKFNTPASDPVVTIMPISTSDVVEAASIALPDDYDSDLEDFKDSKSNNDIEVTHDVLLTRKQDGNEANSVSEFDEGEVDDVKQQGYESTKAILVPPFIQQVGGQKETDTAQQNMISAGSLLMV